MFSIYLNTKLKRSVIKFMIHLSWLLDFRIIDTLSRIILCFDRMKGCLVHCRMFPHILELYL